MMSGTIALESELNKGTTVTVKIPFELTDCRKNQVDKPQYDYRILQGTHILLVEDNDMNRDIANALLVKKGCIVHFAENGEEACRQFAGSEKGYYQMILMDIRMPIMNGFEATRRIRSMEREDADTVPIIAMTADAFAEDVHASFAAGMNAHIAKPINPVKLYDTLCSYMTD